MKFNTLFVAAICAGTLLNSCVQKTAQENQLKYTHTSLVDGDGFAAVKIIGEAAQVGLVQAESFAGADAKSKDVAAKVKAFYSQLLPELDQVATSVQIDFPVKGIPEVHEEAAKTADTAAVDSTAHAAHTAVEAHADYAQHALHGVTLVKDQLQRLTRNTNKELQDFAKKQYTAVSELYTQIGGKEDAHAHH